MNLIRNVRALCILALLLGLYFLSVLVYMHFVRTDLNPYEMPVSYYRVGPNSYLLSTAFVAAALAEMVLVPLLKFLSTPDKRTISKWGRWLLFLAATSLLVTGLVKLGTTHWLSALLHTLLFPFAVMLIGYCMKEGIARRLSIIISVTTAIMLVTLTQAFDAHGLFHPFFGLLEKVDIVLMMVWCAIMLVSIYQISCKSTFIALEEPRA